MATASGIAAMMTAASPGPIFGRRCARRHSSSENRAKLIGVLRTWNELAPMIAPATFSRTYAFIPWMIATTATRNVTETMTPSRVKNERSLLARIWPRAERMTSEKRTPEN